MKAVVFQKHGDPTVLEVRDIATPRPREGEVLIQVKAIGVNRNDLWARQGIPGIRFEFPHISGSDAAGVVVECGSRGGQFNPGDEVIVGGAFGCERCHECLSGNSGKCQDFRIWGFDTGPLKGAQAEFAVVPASNLVRKPRHLAWEDAASLPLCLVTAWRMLRKRAHLQAGEVVLIWGAAGGLGSIALQICNALGGRSIAVANGSWKADFCASLGASEVIDRSRKSVLTEVLRLTSRHGVDIVFEHVGAATWETSCQCLARRGRIVFCGATSGFLVPTDLRFIWTRQQSIVGSHFGTISELREAFRLVENKQIRATVSRVLPLEQIRTAHGLMERNDMLGKIVLTP
jgi:NADPH:quinone reductase-like Zn-dependent oxidoreductase